MSLETLTVSFGATHKGHKLILFRGSIDLATAPSFVAAIKQAFDEYLVVAIDMRYVYFLDTTAIHELLEIKRYADSLDLIIYLLDDFSQEVVPIFLGHLEQMAG